MSEEQNFQGDEINEDLIYQQMFEAIAEELHIEENSGEETPNLDSLSLSKEQIKQIKNGGIQMFKEIMQSRFRQNIEEDLKQESQNELISSAQLLGNIQSQQEGDQQNQEVANILTEIQNDASKQIEEIPQQQINQEGDTLNKVLSQDKVVNNSQSAKSLQIENQKQSSPQNNKKQAEDSLNQQQQQLDYIQTTTNYQQNILDQTQSQLENLTPNASVQDYENQVLNKQVNKESSQTNLENKNIVQKKSIDLQTNLSQTQSNSLNISKEIQNIPKQQNESLTPTKENIHQVQQNAAQIQQKEQESQNLNKESSPKTEISQDNQYLKKQENNQFSSNENQQRKSSLLNNQNEIYNQQICEQEVEYSMTSFSQNNVEKEKQQFKDSQDSQQILKYSTDIAQIQESVVIPLEKNQEYSQLLVQRDDFTEKNDQVLKISSESISPIAKRDKFLESNFISSNQGITISTQNSAQKEGSLNILNSNEKQQQKKSNKIINDIFSLSGIKVGQFKNMTSIANNSVSMTQSNSNQRKFNQSSLTQYQYDSISSLRPRSPQEQDRHIARLYRKQKDVQEKIQKMKEEKINQELSTLKPHTQITKGSQKILSKTNYFKPSEIASIVHKEQIEKRQLLLEEKQKEKQDQELQKCSFHPQLIAKNIDNYQYRSINEFYSNQQEWLQNKDKNIVSQQLDSIQKQLSETTFHPKINKQSQSQIRNLKVEEKLIQDKEKILEKRKKMVEQNQPLFKPVILPKSQELAKKRKEKEFMPCFEISSKFN